MKYLVIDMRKNDWFVEEFESKEEAKDLYEEDQENKYKKRLDNI